MSKIDVEDCCYYNSDNEPYCCELYDNECEAQNCYYKQLQQLKSENEELKEKNNSIHSIASDLQKRNHNLTLENEELKEKLEKIKEIASAIVYGTHFTSDIEGHLKELAKEILEVIESEK